MGCASPKVGTDTTPDVVEGYIVEAAPGPFEQLEASKTWMVRIEKQEDTMFGFKAEVTRAGLMITSIHRQGSLAKWNEEHATDAVRRGDMVVALNGEKDCRNFLKAMRSQILKLQIQRIDIYRVIQRHKVEGLSCVCAEKARSTMCAICLDDYEDPFENLLELPCKHAFHPTCVIQWFEDGGKLECPLCKQSLWCCVKQGTSPFQCLSVIPALSGMEPL